MPSFTVFQGDKNGNIVQATTTKPDELTGDKVLVKVTASGVCGTDLHVMRANADITLGHEGVGVVEKVGPNVQNLKKGDRVGWGYHVNSCGLCDRCLQGEDIFCPKRELFAQANRDQGSFASQAIWREAYLHRIPDGMSDEAAAPLQCAGATVFTALQGLKAGDTVGIMGVGGLGHLAIQFAAKLGARVVVLSGSDSKKEEATRLGAHVFVAMSKRKASDKWDYPINRLLITSAAPPDWTTILPMMATKGVIVPLTVSGENVSVPNQALIDDGLSIQGSLVATRAVHRNMLEFAALHGIAPVVETFPMTLEGIKEAISRLEAGNVRFRAVLKSQ